MDLFIAFSIFLIEREPPIPILQDILRFLVDFFKSPIVQSTFLYKIEPLYTWLKIMGTSLIISVTLFLMCIAYFAIYKMFPVFPSVADFISIQKVHTVNSEKLAFLGDTFYDKPMSPKIIPAGISTTKGFVFISAIRFGVMGIVIYIVPNFFLSNANANREKVACSISFFIIFYKFFLLFTNLFL